jgi:hypothetical protein
MANKKFKIPTSKIDSSECVVHTGQHIQDGEIKNMGTPHKIHVDEWIEVIPVMTMKESIAMMGISQMGEDVSKAEKSLDALCNALAKRVINWNWTGFDGELLPKPYKNPDVFKELHNEELVWLVSASLGETISEQKNESNDSLNTLSAGVNNLPSR